MDPISLIVAALTAGASAALKDTASDAIKDAYAGLKTLLRRKLGAQPDVQSTLDKHEEAPEVYEKALEHELGNAAIADDKEVVAAAQELMAQIDPEGSRAGKYVVTVSGGKVGAIGDDANVTMN